MPMAKKKTSTVARLAMGTAILTVISGCDNRIGQGISDATAPMTRVMNDTAVTVTETLTPAAQAVARAPGVVIETLAPSTTAVVQSDYVVPGAPTYSESSQAANVQTFEAIYGRPVSTDPSQALAAAQTYAIPSYDDGTVIAQPLAAPVASYEQRVVAAVAPTYAPMPDSAVGLVYGDTLTSDSYAVTPAPIAAPATIGGGATVPVFGVLEPAPFAAPMADMAAEVAPSAITPLETMSVATVPLETGAYTLDDVQTFAPDAMRIDPSPLSFAPLPAPTDAGGAAMPLSYDDAIPMTDASAGFVVMPEAPAFESSIGAMPATVDGNVYAPLPATQGTVPAFGGVEIIGNDEAEATYGTTPPVPGTGDRTGTMLPSATMETLSYGSAMTSFETANLETAPLPSPKRTRSAAATTTYGPLTAPVPRRRPAEGTYATLRAPLPQPRPDYDNPVASATTSSSYISIGALPGIGETEQAPEAAPDPAPVAIQAASIQTTEPMPESGPADAAPSPSEPSELSGTSWRLAEVGGVAVDVNTELHFDGSSGFAGGQGPCNSYGGQFVNTGQGRFSMANIFSTDTSCPTIEIEERYLDALKDAGRYEIVPGFSEMTLLDGEGRTIVRFKAF